MLVLWSDTQDSVTVTSNALTYNNYIKFVNTKDVAGMKQMLSERKAARVAKDTVILVLKRHENDFIGDGVPAVEGRIKEGAFIDQVVWVAESLVARPSLGMKMVPKSARRAAPKPVDRKARAAQLLKLAKALDESGKPGALDYYRTLVKDFADTEEAAAASARLKELGQR
jgi:hypothetical protein